MGRQNQNHGTELEWQDWKNATQQKHRTLLTFVWPLEEVLRVTPSIYSADSHGDASVYTSWG